MKSVLRLFITIFFIIRFFPEPLMGQVITDVDNKVDLSITADFNSRYLWRGYTFSEGFVLQPAATISFKKFNLNIWSNIDLKKNDDYPAFNEYDIILYYNFSRSNLVIQPFIQFYFYPGTGEPSTGELTVNAVYTYNNISFTTSQNVDIVNYRGAYYGNAGAGFESQLYRNVYFDCGVYLGWANSKFNETYGGVEKKALNHYGGNFGFSYCPSEIFYTRLRFELSDLLDKDLREMQGSQPVINWGLTLGLEL